MDDDGADPHYMRGSFRGQNLLFYVNGDFFNAGKKILYNPKYVRDYSHFLDHLTEQLQPRFGAVRQICTPTMGHRVRSLEDLRPDGNYVAVGKGRMVRFGYQEIDPHPKKSSPRPNDYPEPSKKYQVPSRHQNINIHGTVLNCWINGNPTQKPTLVVLPSYRNRPESLEEVVEYVSTMPAVKEYLGHFPAKLYLPNGIKVMSIDQIENRKFYVVVKKHECFQNCHYRETAEPGFCFSPHPAIKSPPIPRKLASLHSNKTSSHSSPEHSMTSHNGYRRDREKARREDTRKKRSSERQLDYDQDNRGVFKAKSQNRATRGAQEVEENSHTRTELPVDQRKAETVQDEELDGFSEDEMEDRKQKGRKDKGGRAQSPDQERTHRTNARRAHSPTNDNARKEKEREAQERRRAEDLARAEKQQQQREAMQQKKREKAEEERRKREAEEEKRKERERQRKEEEKEKERRRKEEEEEKRRKKPDDKRGGKNDAKDKTKDRNQKGKQSEESEEERAALTIQAGFRGYQTRRDLKLQMGEKDDGRKDKDKAKGKPKDNKDKSKDKAKDKDKDKQRSARDDNKAREEEAATKIQAGFRGAKARKEVKEKREEKKREERRDRTPERDNDNDREEQERAATKIQAGFRGAKARKEVKEKREEKERRDYDNDREEQERAATKIQAGFRGAKARKEVQAKREEEEEKKKKKNKKKK